MGTICTKLRGDHIDPRIMKTIKDVTSAIQWNDFQKLDLLISEGVDVNVHVKGKISPPITYAAMRGRTKCIDMLLNSGADVNSENIWGETALLKAAAYGREETMDLLLKAGADLNITPCSGIFIGKTPLHMAASRDFHECVDLLIKAGVDVNASTKEETRPALHLAARQGNDTCVKLLIEGGADLTLTDDRGRTALYEAARKGRVKCVNLLIRAGADVNATDFYGNPPLFASFCHIQCARLLLMAGARVNLRNSKGQDLFEYHEVVYNWFVGWKTVRSALKNERQVQEMTALHSVFATEDPPTTPEFNLQSMCRHTVRKHLLQVDPHSNLFSRLLELGLPVSLVSYLMYNKVSCKEIRKVINRTRSHKRKESIKLLKCFLASSVLFIYSLITDYEGKFISLSNMCILHTFRIYYG